MLRMIFLQLQHKIKKMINKEILNKLIKQKRNIIIVIHTNTLESSYNSSLIKFDEDYLYLSNECGLNRYNINTNIYCYFDITNDSKNNDKIFFYFKALVHNLNRKYIIMKYPERIDKGQRRKKKRISLNFVDFDKLNIYDENSIISLNPKTGKLNLANPLIDISHLKNKKVIVQDISSGGIKINFNDFQFIDFHKNKIIEMEFKLVDFQNLQMPIFFLQCQIKHIFKNNDKSKTAGIKFIKRGFIDKYNKVKWKDLLNNYVEEIDGWIFEKYND